MKAIFIVTQFMLMFAVGYFAWGQEKQTALLQQIERNTEQPVRTEIAGLSPEAVNVLEKASAPQPVHAKKGK